MGAAHSFRLDPMKLKKLENVEDLGLCVCGRRIYASRSPVAALHDEPACKAFLELEPDKFLTYVRRSRGIPDELLNEMTPLRSWIRDRK